MSKELVIQGFKKAINEATVIKTVSRETDGMLDVWHHRDTEDSEDIIWYKKSGFYAQRKVKVSFFGITRSNAIVQFKNISYGISNAEFDELFILAISKRQNLINNSETFKSYDSLQELKDYLNK
jgi:hypothetical protein